MIIIKKNKTKGNVSFSHCINRWQKEENMSLVRGVLSCLSGNNSNTDGVGYTDIKWFYSFSFVSFPCRERCSSSGSLSTAQAGEVVLNEMNHCGEECTCSSLDKTQSAFPNPQRKVRAAALS